MTKRIGIIGGSGLYDLEGISNVRAVDITTPFGDPSGSYTIGDLGTCEVVFLARHGEGHYLLPSEINYRANIYGFKELGVEDIVSVSAVGSLKENLKPMDMVIPDQFFDRTNGRKSSFFGNGLVAHISFGHPVCNKIGDALYKAAKKLEIPVHKGGTYINIEGPAFSTKAESTVYRSWGMDVIGMTNLVEAKLAREAEICYATLAMVTDYDCWHPDHDHVTVETVIQYLTKNIEHAKNILNAILHAFPDTSECNCKEALKNAILTQQSYFNAVTMEKLSLLLKKYY